MKIFISSTYEDLKEHRRAVRNAVLRLRQHPIGMEDFGSQPEEWNKAALGEIDGCGALVGIYAHRYGSVPPGDTLSITEQEFDKARALKIPCFCYRVDPKYPWPPEYIQTGEAKEKLDTFLKKVDQLLRSTFTTPDDLAKQVSGDLGRWLAAHPDFPAGSTRPLTARHTLPSPAPSFTGREPEIEQLKQMLRAGGSVAITGIRGLGGVGKTQLALVVANALRDQYPDAQLLVELRSNSEQPRSPAEALAEVVRAFVGLEAKLPDDLPDLARLYCDQLNGQRALILLDDVAAGTDLSFFNPPAGCALLVTSRDALPIPSLTLDQLTAEDARALLLKLAPRVPLSLADEICRLCGYLPLALHAAGGQLLLTIDLSPARYLEQLRDERLRLDKIGSVGVPRGVEATLALSYRQLDPGSAGVFRKLAVFPAPFDSAAEEFIAQDSDHACLSRLVQHSLVQFDAAARYRLHDLARLFADSRLAPDERDAAQLRHAQHYLQVAYACKALYLKGGENTLAALALFDAEFPHLRAGQAFAAANATTGEAAAHLCSDLPTAAIDLLSLRLHPREWIRWLEAGLSAARQLRDRRGEGTHLGNLGNAYRDLGEMRQAIAYLEQALAIARELGDRQGEGADLGNLGIAYHSLGKVGKAIAYYEQALAIARELGNRRGEGADLGNLGIAYRHLGEVRQAVAYYEQALAIARELGDRRGEGNQLGNLGSAYLNLGEVRQAVASYEQALAIARELGDRLGEGNRLGNLGTAYEQLGDIPTAITCVESALHSFEAIESPNAAEARRQLARLRQQSSSSISGAPRQGASQT